MMRALILLPFCFAAVFGSYIRALPYAPLAYAAPAAVVHHGEARSQHHSQDVFGRYNYGYANSNGAKVETRHGDGTVTGSYSHPLPDGRVLTNNYVADKYGFRSSLAPTAAKDFSPVVESAYNVHAPLVATTYGAVVEPQAPLLATKTVSYAAPAVAPVAVKAYAAPILRAGYAAAPLAYGYGAPLAYGYNGLY